MVYVSDSVKCSGDVVQVPIGVEGCVVYGPYVSLYKGDYEVIFEIKSNSKDDVAVLDVVSDGGNTVFVSKTVSSGTHKLSFSIKNQSVVEFRVHSLGKEFSVNYKRELIAVIDKNKMSSFLKIKGDIPKLIVDNFSNIRKYADYGVTFDVGKDIIATINGIKLKIYTEEDIQLIAEIFFINEYTFIFNDKCIVIDIGMNVGMTSLHMSNNDSVLKVCSYEPFASPFHRALKNIGLNKSLSKKIVPNNWGLSNRNEILYVNSQENNTIGVSIAGTTVGDREQIEIRSASEILKPIIKKAKADGHKVIMKVDCEGSEF